MSDHYKFENLEDEGRSPGVGINNLTHTMDNHGHR